jgi:23S rRNA (cytidine1920-2'-O)/16S rRNA (cytidine1409-2'-O)-methyltransferase
MVALGLVATRSQAGNYIKLGKVKVNGKSISKAGYQVKSEDKIELLRIEQYVSRAALKLASVSEKLGVDFANKTVLDVGSSTGGFTQFALKNGAKKVIAVEVGTNQMHPSLRTDPRIELHEKTDIREFKLKETPDIVLMDVSFISLRQILPTVAKLANNNTQVLAMLKPQFEAGTKKTNKGVIKNDKIRRQILKDFEEWSRGQFLILDKADSEIEGAKGNRERFYLLKVV